MKSRVRLAALQILALRENFNVGEIRDAVPLARKLSILMDSNSPQNRTSASVGKVRRTALSKSKSRVVTDLREQDPERYLILSEIDRAIRFGDILPRMSDIRQAGCSLDKMFNSGESKQVAIPRLMKKLSEFPVAELERIFENWKYEMKSELMHDTDYDDLAEFLIKGTALKRYGR